MKLLFLLKEGALGFKRARVATTITVVTITLSLCMIGIFAILVQNLSGAFQGVYGKIHLDAFLTPALTEQEITRLGARIRAIDGVETVTFISPDDARKEFEEVFDVDFLAVLEENPLPASYKIVLTAGHKQLAVVDGVVKQLQELPEIDEVAYKEEIIRLLSKYFWAGLLTAAALGATIFLISTLLIFNTIRLTIHARQTVISIMRLVGATNFFIKAPFIVEGLLQGLLGGVLAALVLWLSADFLKVLLLPGLMVPYYFFLFLLATGTILGLLGSYVSVGRYLRF